PYRRRCRSLPSDAQLREDDGEHGVDDDDEEDALHDAHGRAPAHRLGAAAHAEALVAADRRDDEGEYRRLADADEEGLQIDRLIEAVEEAREADVELRLGHEHAAGDAHDVREHREEWQRYQEREELRQ